MSETQPKPFVFTLMPFEPSFDDIYTLGIKAACTEAGAHCERVDEQIFDESILQRVYNQIAKADLIVAEMTGRNPNVFYEVGYAHALGKRVILLTEKAEDIPFDLKHYPHIVHHNRIAELKAELLKRVKWAVENPKEAKRFFNPTLECFVNETRIVSNPLVDGVNEQGSSWPFFEVAINNSPDRTIEIQDFQLGILVPADWDLFRVGQLGTVIHTFQLVDIPLVRSKNFFLLNRHINYYPVLGRRCSYLS